MARGVNMVVLVGNLGNDPETRYTQGGMAITRISLATTSVRKRGEGQEPEERTEWHRVVFFGKLAEIAGEYLRKGSQVYVKGNLRYDKYTDREGVERYSTDIVAEDMQMLGGRRDDEGGGHSGQRGGGRGSGGSQRSGGERSTRQAPQRMDYGQQPRQPPAQPPLDDFADDDIPF